MIRRFGPWMVLVLGLLSLAPWRAQAEVADQQLSLRTYSGYLESPNDTALFPNQTDVDQQVILRESLKLSPTKRIRFEINVYNLLIGASDKTSLVQTLLNASDEVNRTPYLERHWHNSTNTDAYLTVDRLNMRAKIGRTDLTVGRFPINMSTMFLFTPNDFFAPFRPFDYYREYKPGVDAIRLDHALGKAGQLSVMGVAGYDTPFLTSRTNVTTIGTPSPHYSPVNTSALARAAYTINNFEGALLGGKLGADNMFGFTLQGDIGKVGVRAEGNQQVNRLTSQLTSAAAGGFDIRLNQKLAMQFEQYFNGGGYSNPNNYTKAEANPNPTAVLIGQNYTGAVALYDINGLLNLKSLIMLNDNDQSTLLSFDLAYSVAPNAQLVIELISPRGKGPNQLVPGSEFGTYPGILSIQTGVYF